jgi:hypothetical protein
MVNNTVSDTVIMKRRLSPSILTDFFQKEDIKQYIKDIINPIVNIIYYEIYPYIWFICIYNVFLIFLTLANMILLIRIYKRFILLPKV